MKNAYVFNLIQEALSKLHGITTKRNPYPLKKILSEKYNKINPELVLDIGCGVGNYAFSEDNYIGIDLNFNYVKFAKRKRKVSKLALMDSIFLGFKNETFDVVLMSSIGHHICHRYLQEAILEVKRVIKPNGHFFFVDVIRPLVTTEWMCTILEKIDEGAFFRNEQEYIELLTQHFILEEKVYYRDQFYNTIFLELITTGSIK